VVFNYTTKRFEGCSLENAVQLFCIAPEGWYVVLKNPTKDNVHPSIASINSSAKLIVGHKVNIRGPVSFPLWPGQMTKVLQGHHLRSNQYLIVRVYDEESARRSWAEAVIKPQTPSPSESSVEGGESPPPVVEEPHQEDDDDIVKPDASEIPDLTMGKLLVIKGTDVSFYIPPTGIEVVADVNGSYVREAVTLERLEYCILLDEDGNKRYIRGPAVVFPRTTESFMTRKGSRKFKAIELNEISGLYIKVIADYEEGGKSYKVGDELFITGKDQMIYFPRPEHAIIRYGDQEKIYAIAVPLGEARYVLNRLSGKIELRRGPCMLLPDPRTEVIVRRVLDPKTVRVWFPGNEEAVEYNRQLMELAGKASAADFVTEREFQEKVVMQAAPAPAKQMKAGEAKKDIAE
jgi:major vault protein